jgi:hypothetical protein
MGATPGKDLNGWGQQTHSGSKRQRLGEGRGQPTRSLELVAERRFGGGLNLSLTSGLSTSTHNRMGAGGLLGTGEKLNLIESD